MSALWSSTLQVPVLKYLIYESVMQEQSVFGIITRFTEIYRDK